MKLKSVFSLAAVVLLTTAVAASAQNGGGGGGGRGGRGGRGNRANNANAAGQGAQADQNGNQWQQRRTDRLKTELKASDEEWAVLQPLIEKVMTAQRETRAGAGGAGGAGGRGGRGGRGGQDAQAAQGAPGAPGAQDNAAQRGGSSEAQALRAALDNESTPPADIQAKLAALRQQHKKGVSDLTAARENLKKVLTQRQEAILVLNGILE